MNNVQQFIINDLNNENRKPKDKRMNSFRAKFSEALAIEQLNLRYVAPSKFQNMTEIERKLREYVKREGMKIMVSDDGGSEMFVNSPTGYCVIVLMKNDVNRGSDFRICSLAHEIGHYIDYKHNFRYNSELFDKFSEDSEEIITEMVAWAYAKDMLKVLGYTNWKYFNEIAIASLATYAGGSKEVAEVLIHEIERAKQKRNELRRIL